MIVPVSPALVIKGVIVLVTGLSLFTWGHSVGTKSSRIEMAEMLRDIAEESARVSAMAAGAAEKSRLAYVEQAKAMHRIAVEHEKERDDAIAKGEAVIAGLRGDVVRLRSHWRGCQSAVSAPGPPSGERDEAAELRATDSGALVRIGAEADAQVKACQRAIEANAAR